MAVRLMGDEVVVIEVVGGWMDRCGEMVLEWSTNKVIESDGWVCYGCYSLEQGDKEATLRNHPIFASAFPRRESSGIAEECGRWKHSATLSVREREKWGKVCQMMVSNFDQKVKPSSSSSSST
jgi:hypothetical protein